MKKYVWLIGITAVLSTALFLGFRSLREEAVAVTVRELQVQTIQQTVSCTGKVEEAGSEVKAASTGMTVQVRAAVPENRLRAVAVGQPVVVSGMAFSAEQYSGKVVAIANTAYTTPAGSTVLDAIVALDATDPSLKCGLTAKVNICVNEQAGILLPYSSLGADEDGTEYVYVVCNNRAERRAVTVGEELSEGALITAGVTAGDRLILHVEDVPHEGALVQEATE